MKGYGWMRARECGRLSHRGWLLAIGLVALVGAGLSSGVAEEASDEAPPGKIDFVGRNLMSKANGTFHRWRFTRVEIDRKNPGRSTLDVEVDIASIDTGVEQRDKHLRSDDFFNVEKFPTARVFVHGVTAKGESERGYPIYSVNFDIRIRDVEKTMEVAFEVVSMSPPTAEGNLVLSRTEFGVGGPYRWWNPLSIKDEIPIHFRAIVPVSEERE